MGTVSNASSVRVMVVTDEPRWAGCLAAMLHGEGWSLALRSARDAAGPAPVEADLVVIDVSAPAGPSTCALVRRRSTAPILAVGSGKEGEVVAAFGVGADSYACMHESPRILVARLRALLRRVATPLREEPAPSRFGDLVIDLDRRTVSAGGRSLSFGSPEYEILELLVRRQGAVVRRHELKRASPLRDLADRNLDFHIRRLREQLQAAGKAVPRIANVHSVGFRLTDAATDSWAPR